MSKVPRLLSAAIALLLLAVAGMMVSFDASNVDIARPPSLEKIVLDPASPGSPEDVQALQASLRADPLDRYALYLLSRTTTGDVDRAGLLRLAAERSRRDAEIQTASIQELLKEENYPEALERFDGLVRSTPAIRYKLYDAIAIFAQSTQSRAPLIALLAKSPPWRADFLSYLPRTATDRQTVSLLVGDLRATKSPPTSKELTPIIAKLIADGAAEQAYSLWLTSLDETQLARAGHIYNGNFEARLAQLGPFDWIIVPAKNVVTRSVSTTSNDRGTVLEVAFANSQVSYRNIYQRLMLPPGKFTLTGQYWANRLENDRGLAWRIVCETPSQPVLGEGPAMKGTRDWGPFDVTFTVPDRDCTSQLLRLELNVRAKLDLKVSGMLRFDALRIERADGGDGL